jgi:hypothetical protein
MPAAPTVLTNIENEISALPLGHLSGFRTASHKLPFAIVLRDVTDEQEQPGRVCRDARNWGE